MLEFVLCLSRPLVFVTFGVNFLVQVPFGDMRAKYVSAVNSQPTIVM